MMRIMEIMASRVFIDVRSPCCLRDYSKWCIDTFSMTNEAVDAVKSKCVARSRYAFSENYTIDHGQTFSGEI
jgi:hypothetical protein